MCCSFKSVVLRTMSQFHVLASIKNILTYRQRIYSTLFSKRNATIKKHSFFEADTVKEIQDPMSGSVTQGHQGNGKNRVAFLLDLRVYTFLALKC